MFGFILRVLGFGDEENEPKETAPIQMVDDFIKAYSDDPEYEEYEHQHSGEHPGVNISPTTEKRKVIRQRLNFWTGEWEDVEETE